MEALNPITEAERLLFMGVTSAGLASWAPRGAGAKRDAGWLSNLKGCVQAEAVFCTPKNYEEPDFSSSHKACATIAFLHQEILTGAFKAPLMLSSRAETEYNSYAAGSNYVASTKLEPSDTLSIIEAEVCF